MLDTGWRGFQWSLVGEVEIKNSMKEMCWFCYEKYFVFRLKFLIKTEEECVLFILKFSASLWAQGSSCLPGMRGGEFYLVYFYSDPAFQYAD